MVEFMINPTIKASAAKLKGFSTMLLLQLRVLLEEHKLNQTMNLALNHLNLGDQWKGFHSLTHYPLTLHYTPSVCVWLAIFNRFLHSLRLWSGSVSPVLNHLWWCLTNTIFSNFQLAFTPCKAQQPLQRHGFTRKRSTQRLKHTENLFTKNLQLIGVC